MNLEEIKAFFKEVDEIPHEKKNSITRFLFGISLISSEPSKITGIFFSNKDFEEVYRALVDVILQDESFIEKDMILKRLSDEKELIEKLYKYYFLKREVIKIFEPMGMYGTVMQREPGIESMNFFLLMSMFALNKNNTSPESVAINTETL